MLLQSNGVSQWLGTNLESATIKWDTAVMSMIKLVMTPYFSYKRVNDPRLLQAKQNIEQFTVLLAEIMLGYGFETFLALK